MAGSTRVTGRQPWFLDFIVVKAGMVLDAAHTLEQHVNGCFIFYHRLLLRLNLDIVKEVRILTWLLVRDRAGHRSVFGLHQHLISFNLAIASSHSSTCIHIRTIPLAVARSYSSVDLLLSGWNPLIRGIFHKPTVIRANFNTGHDAVLGQPAAIGEQTSRTPP